MTCRKGDLNDDLSDMNYGRVSKWHYLNSYKETNNVSQNGGKKSLNGEEESANNYNHVQMPKYSVLSLKKNNTPSAIKLDSKICLSLTDIQDD